MEEAIDFYEKNIITNNGKEMGEAELFMEFYEKILSKSLRSLTKRLFYP